MKRSLLAALALLASSGPLSCGDAGVGPADDGAVSPGSGGAPAADAGQGSGGIAGSGGKTGSGGATGSGGWGGSGGAAGSGGWGGSGGTAGSGGASGSGGKGSGGTGSGGAIGSGGKGSGGAGSGGAGGAQKLSVYVAGDSTVSTYNISGSNPKPQAGWGQMLQARYSSAIVTVVNKAVGGMTARRFIQSGNLDAILGVIKAGDYFLVQFGTNDSNTTATYTINGTTYPYFADANTDFKTYLQQYIDGARAKGAIPVLVTPPPRNSAYCGGGRSMAGYAQSMLDLGKAQNVAVVDLSMKTWSYLNVICPKPTSGDTETFFKVNADNTIDGTHFQLNGATMMAGFVADGIHEAGTLISLDAQRAK